MIDRIRLAALALVAAAALATGYALISAGPGDPAAAPPPASAPPGAPQSRAAAVEAWRADILARPLIYPGRHAPAQALTAEQAPPAEPAPRLTGVIVAPNWRSALFATGGARAVAVQEGARIGAYTVRSIRANEVTIDGPGGIRTLHPSYDGVAPAETPAPPLARRAALAIGSPA